MENALRKIYKWLSFFLLLLAIFFYFSEMSIFDSEYIIFYGLSILGLIVSFLGRGIKTTAESSLTGIVGKIGFHANLAIVILFFPPIYHIWGTLILGP
ncbi:hypothetical protein [Bacillus sp. JJ1764]|uniref:hypothetical protein n=1 Tax=Bacillus sp. JJ1764 TaxID=3122964 RepID=UPI002FFE048E